MAGPLLQVSLVGMPQIKAVLDKAQGAVRPAMAASLYQLGCAVISNAIPRTPKDTGTLRNSGYCALPIGSGDQLQVTGGFGGFAKAYALPQHERMDYHHTEGGPKYLERSFEQIAPRAASFIANAMKRAIADGKAPPMASAGVPTSPGPRGSDKPKPRPRGNRKSVRKTARKRPGGGSRGRKR